jgi:hypothetical protein
MSVRTPPSQITQRDENEPGWSGKKRNVKAGNPPGGNQDAYQSDQAK